MTRRDRSPCARRNGSGSRRTGEESCRSTGRKVLKSRDRTVYLKRVESRRIVRPKTRHSGRIAETLEGRARATRDYFFFRRRGRRRCYSDTLDLHRVLGLLLRTADVIEGSARREGRRLSGGLFLDQQVVLHRGRRKGYGRARAVTDRRFRPGQGTREETRRAEVPHISPELGPLSWYPVLSCCPFLLFPSYSFIFFSACLLSFSSR